MLATPRQMCRHCGRECKERTRNQGAAAARRMRARRAALGCQLSEGYTLSLLCGGTWHSGNSASSGMLRTRRVVPPGDSVTMTNGPLCRSLQECSRLMSNATSYRGLQTPSDDICNEGKDAQATMPCV